MSDDEVDRRGAVRKLNSPKNPNRDGARRAARADAAPVEAPRDTPQTAELRRLLDSHPIRFRAHFVNSAGVVFHQRDLRAVDGDGAIRESLEAEWPPLAVALRIVDSDGREIFERLKADR